MSIINNTLLLGSGDEGYNLTRSLRFRSSASASLSRTPASAGNRQKWTWSGWIKRGALGTNNCFFSQGNNIFVARFNNNTDVLEVYDVTGGPYQLQLITSQVFRDPSAWYHLVIATDTTQATASNRVKIYLNGTQITAFSTATYYSQNYNTEVNTTDVTNIGALAFVGQYFDGYLTEINFADGSQLTPSSFGETDTTTGVWKPKRYAGTYGTNGFYLPFTDNSALTTSSNAGLGKDFSGNGNYWTTNNISITSGVTYDSMTDVPTLTSATAANFAVLNPLKNQVTLSYANLRFAGVSASQLFSTGSIGVSSGKYYFEVTVSALGGGSSVLGIGVAKDTVNLASVSTSDVFFYNNNATKYGGGSGNVSYGATYTIGDVIGVALDMDAGSVAFYKNNTSQGTAFSSLTGLTIVPFVSTYDTSGGDFNFGQRPFAYTPPTGYVALNTYNLPTPTIVKGNTVMDATTYSGSGSSQSVVNDGAFKPDFIWIKARNNTSGVGHMLADSVRGGTNVLHSDNTSAEQNNLYGAISSFNSNGFTTASGSTNSAEVHQSGLNYVGWQWKAGQGSTSSNTSGTITSTVSVNASAGFSIVTYTGNGTAGATVGHGLGVAPSFIVTFARNTVTNHAVYHVSMGNTKAMKLNLTSAEETFSGWWNNTSPTSSVFSIGTFDETNKSSTTYVAYCFASIAGYSSFGSYTGNGSTDGPFVYTGFRPKFIMAKVSTASNWWIMFDSTRNPYNAANFELAANLSDAEYTANTSQYTLFDFLSNGFKLRTGSLEGNSNGQTYIYIAFAENPFKNALAR